MLNKAILFDIGKILILAGMYWFSGWAGLFLALPQGFSTIFWPASGIAMAFVYLFGYRFLIGVFLGCLILNLTTYYPLTDPDRLHLLTVNSLGNAIGATLQAFVGVWFVRKFIGKSTKLERLGDIVRFSLFAGPLSCVISPSLGIGALVLTQTLSIDNVLFTWGTWYAGDALGVLIFAPAFVLFLGGRTISLRRKLMVCVPFFLLFILIVFSFFVIRDLDRQSQYQRFVYTANIITQDLSSEIENYIFELASLKAFFKSSNKVDADDFEVFVQEAFTRHPAIVALEWAPRVSRAERKMFEAAADLKITERAASGEMVYADAHDEYFPVYFMEPFEGNEKALGYNLISNEKRKTAIEKSCRSGTIYATAPVQIVQDRNNTGEDAFLVFNPIYLKDVAGMTPEKRHEALLGLVLGVFRYDGIVRPIIDLWKHEGIELRVLDKGQNGESVEVFNSLDMQRVLDDSFDIKRRIPVDVAGRTWVLELYKNPQYLLANVNWSIWIALAGGLGFAFFVCVFLLSVTGQTAVVEALVDEKTRALRESNAFADLVRDNVPDMIFVKDRNFKIVSANKTFLDTYAPEERDNIIGSTGLEHLPKSEQKKYFNENKKALDEGYSEFYVEKPRYDGMVSTLSVRNIRFENVDGEPFVLVVARDITQQKAAERDLIRSNKELQDFAYVASHDLKAPLRHVSLSAGFLQDNYRDQFDDQGKKLIDSMIKSTDRMQNMIESLLSYSRAGRSGKDDFESVNLSRVLKDVRDSMGAIIEESNTVICAQNLPNVKGHEDFLHQLFQNLIQNSIKYAKEGVAPQIEIEAEAQGRMWKVSFADNGIGIGPDYKDKVFQIFQRLHRDDEYDGVGIGLSICQRIVEFHGGKIWLEPDYEAGAKFVFLLESA